MSDDTQQIIAAQLTAAYFSKFTSASTDQERATRIQELTKELEPQFFASAQGLATVFAVHETFVSLLSGTGTNTPTIK